MGLRTLFNVDNISELAEELLVSRDKQFKIATAAVSALLFAYSYGAFTKQPNIPGERKFLIFNVPSFPTLSSITGSISDFFSGNEQDGAVNYNAIRQDIGRWDSPMNPQDLENIVREASQISGLTENLIYAVMATESKFAPNAVSPKGAQGLMQLLPGTARSVGVSNPSDPRQNAIGGARYLEEQFEKFGTLELALAAYNAGPEAVRQHNGIPPYRETQEYVRRVLETLRRYTAESNESLRLANYRGNILGERKGVELMIPVPGMTLAEYERSVKTPNTNKEHGEARNGGERRHAGNDLEAPKGTAVLAAADGVVISVDNLDNSSAGKYIVIDHGGNVFTRYLHNDQNFVVEKQRVRQGDRIAVVGSTGTSSGWDHLHFEVRDDAGYEYKGSVDPLLVAYNFHNVTTNK